MGRPGAGVAAGAGAAAGAAEERDAERERVSATYNRLVVFDVSRPHRVSDIFEGERFTFAVNVWREPPSKFAGA